MSEDVKKASQTYNKLIVSEGESHAFDNDLMIWLMMIYYIFNVPKIKAFYCLETFTKITGVIQCSGVEMKLPWLDWQP